MSLSDLTHAQLAIVGNCLRIAADRCDMFPDWEFQTIFGVSRKEMASFAAHWPDVDERSGPTGLAINNAMGNLLGYPHGQHDDWSRQFPFSQQALRETFAAWRNDSDGLPSVTTHKK